MSGRDLGLKIYEYDKTTPPDNCFGIGELKCRRRLGDKGSLNKGKTRARGGGAADVKGKRARGEGERGRLP